MNNSIIFPNKTIKRVRLTEQDEVLVRVNELSNKPKKKKTIPPVFF